MKSLAVLLVAACNTFEDPTLVVDLRVIAVIATPPEQVIDVDPAQPPVLADLMAQLAPVSVCATVADPARASSLAWSMTACVVDNGRCDPGSPHFEIARGEVIDPEVSGLPFCATVDPSIALLSLLAEAYAEDPVHGLAGLTYSVEVRVGAPGANPDDDQFAVKQLRVMPRLPADRVANHNPTLQQVQILTPAQQPATIAPCTAGIQHPLVGPGAVIDLIPFERSDTREAYAAATVGAGFEPETETIRYQWLATAGSLADEETGGPTDFAGNEANIATRWRAPADRVDAQLWLIQRDERGGVSVYPFCVGVVPP